MVFPKARRSITTNNASSDRASASSTSPMPASAGATGPQSQPTIGKLVNLSVEQTKDLNFPVGCPVWYNFSQSSGARMGIREGEVDSINLDIMSKTLVFVIVRKDSPDASVDTVFEDDIAYASNCPVALSSCDDEDPKKVDGEILFAKPVKGESGSSEMTYIVKIFGGSGHALGIEEGVKAGRLKYREAGAAAKQQSHSVKQVAQHIGNSIISTVPVLSVSEEERSQDLTHPSEIEIGSVEDAFDHVRSDETKEDQKKFKTLKVPNNDKTPSLGSSKSRSSRIHDDRARMQSHAHHGLTNIRRNERRSYGDRYDRNGHYSVYGKDRQSFGQDKRYRGGSGGSVPRQTYKRKVESVEKVLDKRVCWEAPHSWHENDGAI